MASPPDSSAIDNSLIGVLLNDAQLAALMPDGVYFDQANAGAKRFVIVSLVDEIDLPTFGGRAIESGLYLVKAVALSTSGGDVKSAAARIDALLEDTIWTISDNRLSLMTSHRIARIRATEVDDVDPDLRWLHRGARYRVDAAVLP